MEQLTGKKRLRVVSLYFSGLTLDQITAKTGVSKGSVFNIIEELKAGNFPETADLADQVDTLRELAVDLAKLKMTAGQSALGIALLKRIFELGLDPTDMERWPLLLNSIKTQDDAKELIEVAYEIRDIRQKSGVSLSALEEKVKQLDQKAEELAATTAAVKEAKSQLTTLNIQKEHLQLEVDSMNNKYNWLIPRVQELEHREKLLLARHETMMEEAAEAKATISNLKKETKILQKTGLSINGLVGFNRKLATVAGHHGIKPALVRERLLHELKHLDKGLGLETLVEKGKQTLKETSKAIHEGKSERASLEAVALNLKQEKQNLECSIKEIREQVGQQITQLIPIAQQTVHQIDQDLKVDCVAVLTEIKQLKDRTIEVGQDIGKYEGVLEESAWVGKLMRLFHGDPDVSAVDARTVALLVNRGITAWLGQHGAQSTVIQMLTLKAGEYVRKLEEWQISK